MRIVGIPHAWRMGGHGDPIAVFDRTALHLHEDGTVTWAQYDKDGDVVAGHNPEEET